MRDLVCMPETDRMILRPGTTDDTDLLIEVYTLASEGIANHVWAQIAVREGRDIAEVARERALGKFGDPAITIWVAELDGRPAGAILTYAVGQEPEALDGLPPLFVPLVVLENQAPGTHYVNVLAVLPEFRRCGVASRLLARAVEEAGERPLSLIVSDANVGARATYAALGFRDGPTESMVKDGWNGRGETWILMIRDPRPMPGRGA